MDPSDARPDATPAPGAPARWGRRAAWTLAGSLAVLAGAASLLAAMVGTRSGSAWLLGRVPGLQCEGVQGTLLGPALSVQRLTLQQGANRLQLTGLRLQGLDWQWRPQAGAWWGLRLAQARADEAIWRSGPTPASAPRPAAPRSLRLPFTGTVDKIEVTRLQIDGLSPLTDLQATLALGASAGREHRLSVSHVRYDRFEASAEWQQEADGPLAVQAQASLHSLPEAGSPWQAELYLAGPLAAVDAQARLSGAPGADAAHPAPSLEARARLRPFSAWPLGTLRLSTQALDLAALLHGAPHTRLSGDAQVDTQGADLPIHLHLHLRNAAPSRWDQGGLPLRSVQLDALGHTAVDGGRLHLARLALTRFSAEPGAAGSARIEGSGEWAQALPSAGASAALGEGRLALQLAEVQPAALDQRLPAMTLSGPVDLRLQGLPPPDLLLGEATATPHPQLTITSTLHGQRTGPSKAGSPAVQLQLDAQASEDHLALRTLQVRSAGAQASATGDLRQEGPQRWRWDLHAALQDFDPQVWWPGVPGGAWQRGPHQLNATLDSRGAAAQATLQQVLATPQAWRRVDGQTTLTLAPSQLAGVPLQGRLSWDSRAATPLSAQLQSAANQVTLTMQRGTDPGIERWAAEARLPALATLAPLLALADRSGTWVPTAGSLHASLTGTGSVAADGPWQWQGRLDAKDVATTALRLGDFALQGQGANRLAAPLSITLKARALQGGGGQVDAIDAQLSGSAAQHHLSLQVDSPARPPAWFEQLLGAHTGSGSRVRLAADGRWQTAVANLSDTDSRAPGLAAPAADVAIPLAGRWVGRLTQLEGRARDGSGQPWLLAKDLGLSLSWNDRAQLLSADAEPGRIELPGTALRWSTAHWQRQAGHPLPGIDLQAQIEPFALAPLLARAQPDLGWHGDLSLAGQIRVRSGERFDADLVFERRSGDLSVADDARDPTSPIRALGLSDLRLGLSAHDGTWHFTQALAGRRLGEMAGVATVHTGADRAWPSADAPLDGVLQLHVANLGAWGAWVPPGWRLGGELQTSASFGGRFGAPEVTGRLSGQHLSALQPLLGVALTDGQIEMSLQGATARVDSFSFRGGDGRMTLQGQASLGETPQAHLRLTADHFLLLGRVDRRLVTSGQASVDLTRDALQLDGKLVVDEGLIDFSRGNAPGLDDDVSVIDADAATPVDPAATAAAKPARPTVIHAQLDLGHQLHVKGHGLDTTLRGVLDVSNPGRKLTVRGKVSTERGTYAAYGQKLEIERGELSFNGPVDDPRLDIYAVRPNLDVVVGVAVTGSALNPRVRLASDTDMSDADKLSWLVLGRASAGLGQADTALLQSAAMALLAGDGEGPTDTVLKSIGLTDLSFHQTTTGDVHDTVVTLGRQLSRRWYVGYERGVNATTGTWQIIYRLAQRFTLRAQTGADNALDVIWSWRWP